MTRDQNFIAQVRAALRAAEPHENGMRALDAEAKLASNAKMWLVRLCNALEKRL